KFKVVANHIDADDAVDKWKRYLYQRPVLPSTSNAKVPIQDTDMPLVRTQEPHAIREEIARARFCTVLMEKVCPLILRVFEDFSEAKKQKLRFNCVKAMLRALADVHAYIKSWMLINEEEAGQTQPVLRIFGEIQESGNVLYSFSKIIIEFQGALHAKLQDKFRDCMAEVFVYGFAACCSHFADDCNCTGVDPSFYAPCTVMDSDQDCSCKACILEDFRVVTALLVDLELIECLGGDFVSSHLKAKIRAKVKELIAEAQNQQHSGALMESLETIVGNWLNAVYWPSLDVLTSTKIRDLLMPCAQERAHQANTRIKMFMKAQLIEYAYHSIFVVVTSNIFNIIVEFPESAGILDDLKAAFVHLGSSYKRRFVDSLKTVLSDKLLQPGVATHDILTAYVSALKALRYLDPSGVLALEACSPMKNYLMTRNDTVKTIVVSLTDSKSGGLADELTLSGLNPAVHAEDWDEDGGDSDYAVGELEDENSAPRFDSSMREGDWEDWEPDTWDVQPEFQSKASRHADIISMLVNIYGSRRVFIQEYRKILAERIIDSFNLNLDCEIRCKEFLKMRFGEAFFQNCEVMLTDVNKSLRLASMIEQESATSQPAFQMLTLVRSVQFWPNIYRGETFELPSCVMTEFDHYRVAFETLKGNRTLIWDPHMGEVEIRVELQDRVLSLKFETEDEWIHADKECFASIPTIAYYDNDDEVARECEAETTKSKMDAFWSYIVGMLKNLKTLPLNRIHSMLKMFAMQEASAEECSLDELKEYLLTKVRSQELFFSNNMFKLPPV
ncbi:unnamed protein product, partial [Notodromas monacha]